MDLSTKRPFLFVHSNGPTHMHARDELVKTDIRRHIMVDIGKARRKPIRNPKVEVRMRSPPTAKPRLKPARLKRTRRDEPAVASRADNDQALLSPMYPFWDQHPLALLERQWEMDMFSAYGIALVVSEGKNRRARDKLASGFWFPFAFRASRFLNHFQQALTSPGMLTATAYAPENKFQIIALQRSSGTITCLETIMSDPDITKATANNVIRAVLASICYNFVCSEFTQASTHLKGLGLLISAKGGIESLQDDNDLRLMIFWVDITASLLFTRKPQYPLPSSLIPHCALPIPHDILTPALQALAKEAQIAEDIYTIEILTCLQSLYAIASYIESDIAVNHHAPWQDEESIGLRLNPLAHRLLSLPPLSGSSSAFRGNHTATALQLGQIIWIIWVKRRYRAYPGSPAGYASKLLGLMMVDELGGGQELEFLPVRLWLLVLCAVSCSEREKGVAVGMIGDVMSRWGLNSWSAVMSHVTQMPWVSMLDALCTDIERSCIITSHS